MYSCHTHINLFLMQTYLIYCYCSLSDYYQSTPILSYYCMQIRVKSSYNECIVCCYSECILYPTPGKLKNQPDHGGNRTRDLWFASPMLYQLSYEVKSVRVFDISNRLDLVAQLVEHWTSKPKVAGSIPTVVRLIFQLAWCGIYTQSNNTLYILHLST